MILCRQKKAWYVSALFPDRMYATIIYAESLPKAFRRFSKQWHMDDVLEISITEVTSDERSKGVS